MSTPVKYRDPLPMFSSGSLIVSGLMFKSWISLELNFNCGSRSYIYCQVFALGLSHLPSLIKESLFSLLNNLGAFANSDLICVGSLLAGYT